MSHSQFQIPGFHRKTLPLLMKNVDKGNYHRSAGSRTAWGAIRALFREPKDNAAQSDIDAVRQGEGRAVSCLLKGPVAPFPRRRRQGTLALSAIGVFWRPSWSLHPKPLMIPRPAQSVEVRAAERSEWNMKKGGKAFGVVPVPEFQVVIARTDVGALELAVPSTDVELVMEVLRQSPSDYLG